MLDLSIIILTYNEERNIEDCLQSIADLDATLYVVDSGSTDATVDIAARYKADVFVHPFENYAAQRNWALANLPIHTTWVLHMDADHRMTQTLKSEIKTLFTSCYDHGNVAGYLISRRTLFMGKWIRFGGHYPTYHAILFRKNMGYCEPKLYDQHFVIQGSTKLLKGDMIDIITESLSTFTLRHNHWSNLEAQEVVAAQHVQKDKLIQANLHGNPIEQRRYLKNTYYKFPPFIRAIFYFFIRYVLRLGFLDGRRGLIFHFLQGFWFRFLVDAKIYELKRKNLIQKAVTN